LEAEKAHIACTGASDANGIIHDDAGVSLTATGREKSTSAFW
jgi:hypothetical protein